MLLPYTFIVTLCWILGSPFLSNRIILQEDRNAIIAGPDQIDYREKIGRVLVADEASSSVLLYDSRNGHLLQTYKPNLSLSDSLAKKFVLPLSGYKFLSISEIMGENNYRPTEKELSGALPNQYCRAQFISDTEFCVLAKLFSFLTLDNSSASGNSTPSVAGRAAIIIYSLRQQRPKEVIVLNSNNINIDAQAHSFIVYPENKGFLVTVTNYIALKKMNYDSAFTLGHFSRGGSLLKCVSAIPEEGRKYFLDYGQLRVGEALDSKNNPFVVYQRLPYIYDILHKKKIHLSNLPDSNNIFFDSVSSFKRRAVNTRVPWDELYKHAKIFLQSLIIDSDNNFIVEVSRVVSHTPWKVEKYLYKYSQSGDYVASINLSEDIATQCKAISLYGKKNTLMSVMKDSSSYFLIFFSF
jgi:hypothetical protein